MDKGQAESGDVPRATSPKPEKPSDYPDPFIVPPSAPHTHSIIFLHGRGDTAKHFGEGILRARDSRGKTLAEVFPGVKFIFPEAKKRRVQSYARIVVTINQWFDYYSPNNSKVQQDLQRDGLRESGLLIHSLLVAEVGLVGARNVVLAGLSQGCALALHVFLSYPYLSPVEKEEELASSSIEGESLGGLVGMSGWLPFEAAITKAAFDSSSTPPSEGVLQNSFEKSSDGTAAERLEESTQLRACNFVREIANLPFLAIKNKAKGLWTKTPVFLGHGTADWTIHVRLGTAATDLLQKLGISVTWKRYKDFGHWYKEPDEIDDIIAFLENEVGWKKE